MQKMILVLNEQGKEMDLNGVKHHVVMHWSRVFKSESMNDWSKGSCMESSQRSNPI